MDLKGHQDEMFVDKMTQFKLEIHIHILKDRFFEWWLRFVDPDLIKTKTGHKTRYILAEQLIRAHNKVPNMKLES